ncbi:MAG TPA: hypothetical protein VN661_09690 [Candidatus Acidoferrales bacterium]|nr:hypothetical protein [Candidatus Acidoferrales bacterium]
MKVPTSNEVMTTLLSGLLTFVLVGCTQFPDNFDFAAKQCAPAFSGSQSMPASPAVAKGAAN